LVAQDYSYGKVSKEELLEKNNPSDESAAATYLYKYRKTYFEYLPGQGFRLYTDVHERIKIYTKEGFDYATKKIDLYKNGSSIEKVGSLKAMTYNLENGKITTDKLKKDGEFETELSQNRNQKSFTMPNVKEGSVLEYRYIITSPFVANIDEFVFQHDIPVKKLEAVLEAPEYFNFRINMKGFLNVVPKVESENRKLNIQQRVAQDSRTGIGARTKMETGTIDFQSNISSYDLANIPALKEEPYVNGIDNYRSGVKYELSYIKFPNSPVENYSTIWEDVVKTIYESADFGAEMDKKSYYKDDIETLMSSIEDNQQKVYAIFNFAKGKVKWDGNYGKYTSKGVKKAYKEGTGNVADINLMLTSMLRYAGFDANPVLLSTRNNGIPLFPTREGYNYVICSVESPEGLVLLDASSVYSEPNVLPFRTLNWQGRLIKEDGSSVNVDLYPKTKSTKKVFLNAQINENSGIEGKVRVSYNKHDAMNFRADYFKSTEDEFLEKLEGKNGGIEINDFLVKNAKDLKKSIVASYSYKMENGIDIIAGKMYLSPMFFLKTTENPFKLEKREFPIDFGYPSAQEVVATITIPEGYKVEALPEPAAIGLPDGMGVFKYKIMSNANSIQLKVSTAIEQPIIASYYYESLKEYYKKMVEKMNEKVVLSKITENGSAESTVGGR